MKKVLVVLITMFALATAASANNYKIDDAAVDEIVGNAVDVTPVALMGETAAALPAAVPASASLSSEKSVAATIVLNFFFGGFGVHRHYMGTRPWMWAIYTFTAGGIFGVVPFVDLIVEIIAAVEDNSVARYCGNTKFFMWG